MKHIVMRLLAALMFSVPGMVYLSGCSMVGGGAVMSSGSGSVDQAFDDMSDLVKGLASVTGDSWKDDGIAAQYDCPNRSGSAQIDYFALGSPNMGIDESADAVEQYLKARNLTVAREEEESLPRVNLYFRGEGGLQGQFDVGETKLNIMISSACGRGTPDPKWEGHIFSD